MNAVVEVRRRRVSTDLRRALALLAGLVLLWVVGNALAAVGRGEFAGVLATTPRAIAAALICYALGHLMRIVRLTLLIGDARISIRTLALFHLATAGVALGTPLRLGDAYRAAELGGLTGGLVRGVTFVWLERLFDAAVILPVLLFVIALAAGDGRLASVATYAGIAVMTSLFVIVSVLLVALLPDNLRRIGTYLIRRHDAAWTIRALRWSDDARATVRRIPTILAGKFASLIALTVMVWLFEILGFALANFAWTPADNPLRGLFAFLSQTTTGGTLPGILRQGPALELSIRAYLAAGQVPLALVALAAGIGYYRTVLAKGRTA